MFSAKTPITSRRYRIRGVEADRDRIEKNRVFLVQSIVVMQPQADGEDIQAHDGAVEFPTERFSLGGNFRRLAQPEEARELPISAVHLPAGHEVDR